jgi:hypothetical protein
MASASFKIKSGVRGGYPMRGDRPESPDGCCKILQFRQRDDADAHRRCTVENAGRDIDQLLDLSRYEEPGRDTGDYKARMVENVAAVVLLSALVAFAAFDVISLEQIQHCASAGGC